MSYETGTNPNAIVIKIGDDGLPIEPVTLPADKPTSPDGINPSDVTGPLSPPIADFSYTVRSGGIVEFTNTTTGDFEYCRWNFADGQVHATKEINITHQFLAAGGKYRVTLLSANMAGRSTKEATIEIPATPPEPTVDFTYVRSGRGLIFTYTGNIAGAQTWDFGDGNFLSISKYENVIAHLYGRNGSFSVSLGVGNRVQNKTITVDSMTGDAGVLLSWTSNSFDEDGFHVEQSTDGATWNVVATTTETSITITLADHGVDTTLDNYFRVKAYNVNGSSDPTNEVFAPCGEI